MDDFASMPVEMLTVIFSFLPRRDRFICMCLCERWRDAMSVPSLWQHMSVRLDIDFFEVSTIQLTIEYCKYIKSLELRFEYPEEPMQWINYKMMDITKRTYRFLSIFVNKNLQITRLLFNNFCDFYRSKKILYYLTMFLRSQYMIKIISFNGSYFSKKALIKILTSSIAANQCSIEYLDIQNSYYEHDHVMPGQNMLSSQFMICLTSINNLRVLRIDFESLITNGVLEGLLIGNCDSLEYLDIRIAEHDINNVNNMRLYPNSVWIGLKKKFEKLKVALIFYEIGYKYENIETILTRSLPLYSITWINDNLILKELYLQSFEKYSISIEVIKILLKSDFVDDIILAALSHCPKLKFLQFCGRINDVEGIKEALEQSQFTGFKYCKKHRKNMRGEIITTFSEKVCRENYDDVLCRLQCYEIN